MAAQLGLPRVQGVVVTGVYTRGPAAKVPWSQNGGDVILKANKTPIDSPGQLRNLVADFPPGSQLTLQVWQNGRTREFNVTIGRRPTRVQGV